MVVELESQFVKESLEVVHIRCSPEHQNDLSAFFQKIEGQGKPGLCRCHASADNALEGTEAKACDQTLLMDERVLQIQFPDDVPQEMGLTPPGFHQMEVQVGKCYLQGYAWETRTSSDIQQRIHLVQKRICRERVEEMNPDDGLRIISRNEANDFVPLPQFFKIDSKLGDLMVAEERAKPFSLFLQLWKEFA
jgi:hypothetical protein